MVNGAVSWPHTLHELSHSLQDADESDSSYNGFTTKPPSDRSSVRRSPETLFVTRDSSGAELRGILVRSGPEREEKSVCDLSFRMGNSEQS